MGVVTIGCDVGQRVDPTAIAVCECEQPGKGQPDRFIVRHLERLEIGTPYPDIAARIAAVYRGVVSRMTARLSEEQTYKQAIGELRGYLRPDGVLWGEVADSVSLLVDATGVGTPVVDLIREQPGLEGVRLTGVFFTSGDRCSVSPGAREGSVGKAFLVSRLQSLLQYKRVRLPQTAEARALADELLNYEIRVTADASMTAGAFKTGTHDDLVTALGLALLHGPSKYECGSTRYA